MDSKLNSHRLLLCKKPHEKRHFETEKNNFFNSVENSSFWQSGKGGTIAKSSKMADFLGKLRKAKK